MSCIHFKFKSSLEYEKVTFDGLQISLGELKEAIMKQKKIGGANQYTLSIRDAQSKKVYDNDSEMISRNSSVIISRVPLVNAPKIPKTQLQDPSLPQPASSTKVAVPGIPSTSLPALTSGSQQNKLTAEELSKTADLSSANATEEEKVMAMMNQSADGYNPSQYVKFPPRRGGGVPIVGKPPPPTYRCYRCGQPGHYINLCPTNGDPKYDNYRYKPVRGTPSNQVIPVPSDVPGAMLDRHGKLVVRAVDYQAFLMGQMKGKKTAATVEAPKEAEVPSELICHLCKELVRDAVIIPCCGESFCYECIQEHLCENEFTCPMCKATDVSPERLAPNKALRTAAKNFQMKMAEQKSESLARGFVKQAPLANIVTTTTTSITTSTTVTPSQTPTVAPSQPSQATSTASSTLTTTTTQSVDSTTTSSTFEPTSSQTESVSSEQTPKSTEEPETSAPMTVAEATKSVATTTSASLAPTSLEAGNGLVSEAKTDLEKALLMNGLAGIAGSVPVVKTDTALAAQLLGSRVLPPPSVHPAHLAGLLTHSMLPQPPMNSSKNLDRLAADLLLRTAAKKSPSPPPLTAEEFYRQQKLLKLLTKKTGSRSNTPGSDSSSSGSGSNLRSRSRSRSWSYDSRSRSRSRSPHHKKQKTKKPRSHKHSKRHEKDSERSKHRSHRKHGDKKEEGSKRASKRHRSPSASPDRKRLKEDTSLAQDEQHGSRNITPVRSGGEEDGRGSRRHKHKKRSKRKHKHRSRDDEDSVPTPINGEEVLPKEAETVMDVEAGQSEEPTKDTPSHDSIRSPEEEIGSTVQEDNPPPMESESVEPELPQESPQVVDAEITPVSSQVVDAEVSAEKNPPKLVPYHDSSTTEVERNEDTTEADTTQGTESGDDEELLDLHVDGAMDGLDEELGVASLKQGVVTPETGEEELTPKEDDNEESDKEEGEISDSDGDPVTSQHTQSPLEEPNYTQKPRPPSPQEDLRVELERAKKKRELESSQSQSDIPDVAFPPVVADSSRHHKAKKKQKRERVPVSSDEYDSSSSSEGVESEVEQVERIKSHKTKRSRHKHSSKSRERERRVKEVKSKKKKEHGREKDLRVKKLKKTKSHHDERKLKKSDKVKKLTSSRRH